MKYVLPIFVLLLSAVYGHAQFEGGKQIYSSPKLKEEIVKHKTVAILPFSASIVYKRPPKNYDENASKQEASTLAVSLQQSMYTFLLRKANNFSCGFQNVDRTNTLLKQAGVYENLDLLTQDSICKILKVDAVIQCKYIYEKTATEGGAIVKAVVFGGFGGKTGSGGLTMHIYNGADGELLWRFYKAMDDDVMNSSDDVIEHMMRKVARNFPYDK